MVNRIMTMLLWAFIGWFILTEFVFVEESSVNEQYRIPEPYYTATFHQYSGTDNLRAYLERKEWARAYEAGKFDCTEMSAFLEYRLENEGWHTVIVVADEFEGGGHCWLLVETKLNQYMPVEATSRVVVDYDNPKFKEYFNYNYTFETIYDAMDIGPTAFDWWNIE